MTTTLTLTDFLLARIAEDEVRAREIAYDWLAEFWPHVDDDTEWEITMVDSWIRPAQPSTPPYFRRFANHSESDLKWFATRYADHPDFRPEWRP